MDVHVSLSPEETAALAALADQHSLTVGEILRQQLDPWLGATVDAYQVERGHGDGATGAPAPAAAASPASE